MHSIKDIRAIFIFIQLMLDNSDGVEVALECDVISLLYTDSMT